MNDWLLVTVLMVGAILVLRIKFFRTEKIYKEKSEILNQKIEELKLKNAIFSKKLEKGIFQTRQLHYLMNHFLQLHELIVKKRLK